MLYSVIRIILALAGAAVAFVMITYSDEAHKYSARNAAGSGKAWSGAAAVFAAAAILLHLIPAENLTVAFATPEDAFLYNHTGSILEIVQYSDCAFVIVSTGDEKITTHVLPMRSDGRWKLETLYNRRRKVSTLNYCIIERLYVPGSNDCFVIVSHNTEGNISDVPNGIIDNRNTKFNIVDYPDRVVFYYGFVEDMAEDYILHVDGNVAIGGE